MFERRGSLVVASSPTQAFHRAERVLRRLGGEITRSDPQAGRIEAKLPMSARSWGERVHVDVAGDEGEVLLTVVSRSRLPTTLFDFGKNADNVRRFVTDPEFDSTGSARHY